MAVRSNAWPLRGHFLRILPFYYWMKQLGLFFLISNAKNYLTIFIASALDTSTEKDIQKALQNLVQGRSSLSIAHRLSVSTLQHAIKQRTDSFLLKDHCFSRRVRRILVKDVNCTNLCDQYSRSEGWPNR